MDGSVLQQLCIFRLLCARNALTVVGTAAALRSAVTTPVARASGLSQQLLAAAPVEAPTPRGAASATKT